MDSELLIKNNNRLFKLIPLVIFLIISILYAYPLFQNVTYGGEMDWDQFVFWNEAARQIIVQFHQIPLWNPYANGGNVLLAHPHSSWASPFFMLILLFGSVIGLKIAWIAHLFLGMCGMYFLARFFKISRLSGCFAAIVFMLSSMFTLHLTEGHSEWMVMGFVPWFVLCVLKAESSKKHFIGAIFFLSGMILWGSVDVLSISCVFVSIYIGLYSFSKKNKTVVFLILIFWLSFLVCAFKLLPLLEFVKDNPRTDVEEKEIINLDLLPKIYLSRKQGIFYEQTKWATPYKQIKYAGQNFKYGWHEYGAYVGIIPLFLCGMGMLFYFRQHWAFCISAIICLWISLGNGVAYSLWDILRKLPLYDSLDTPSRYALGVVFSISIFSGLGLSKVELFFKKRYCSWITVLIFVIVCIDLMAVNYPLLGNTFTIPPAKIKKHSEFKQRYRSLNLFPLKSRSSMYMTLLSNSGILASYEVMGVKQGKVMVEGDAGYKGEAYLSDNNGIITKTNLTPNFIEVALELENPDMLIINQNYSNGWQAQGTVNSSESYNGLLSLKVSKGKHNVLFYYFPVSFLIGGIISMVSLIGLLFLFFKKNLVEAK